jgi:predicted lipoprotein with Yx(FWY)xxD motif
MKRPKMRNRMNMSKRRLLAAATLETVAAAVTVATASSLLGRILVGREDRTLYLFEMDKRCQSACSRARRTYWRPLSPTGKKVENV